MKRYITLVLGFMAGMAFVVTCETPNGLMRSDGGLGAGGDALAAPNGQFLTADTDANQLQTGTISTNAMKQSVVVLQGPFVVTDLGATAAPSCWANASTPTWTLTFTGTAGNAVHGARLFVKAGDSLTISTADTSACGFVYSGFRPYGP